MKKIAILGSTGSIGVSALDVVTRNPGELQVVALAAGRNIDLLREQVLRFRPEIVSVIDEDHARSLRERLGPECPGAVLWGEEGYCRVATAPAAGLVLSAIVGAAGLVPTMAAIEAGRDVALANKETLVTAGPLVTEKARLKGVRLIPVDSEHSAVFQCIEGNPQSSVGRVILTASGGPFLRSRREELERVTVTEALRHPNWAMGRKITIDSATMMNKGLEVIEAQWLFGVPPDMIRVVVHPQSIIHSMVAFRDGAVIAQLGLPDMKAAIAYALSYPERLALGQALPAFSSAAPLTFAAPDLEKFPCLALAFEACRRGGTLPAVLNAANEVAVNAFLEERTRFAAIPRIVQGTMEAHGVVASPGLEEILSADRWARAKAAEFVQGCRR